MTEQHVLQMDESKEIIPKWIPVLLGIFAPLFFATQALLIKHLSKSKVIPPVNNHLLPSTPLIDSDLRLLQPTPSVFYNKPQPSIQQQKGFCPATITFSTSAIASLLNIIISLSVSQIRNWVDPISWETFCVGFIGSCFNTLGIVAIQIAFSQGPADQVAALGSVSTLMLVVFECLTDWKIPYPLEIVSMILCIVGSLIIVVPKLLAESASCQKCFRCLSNSKCL